MTTFPYDISVADYKKCVSAWANRQDSHVRTLLWVIGSRINKDTGTWPITWEQILEAYVQARRDLGDPNPPVPAVETLRRWLKEHRDAGIVSAIATRGRRNKYGRMVGTAYGRNEWTADFDRVLIDGQIHAHDFLAPLRESVGVTDGMSVGMSRELPDSMSSCMSLEGLSRSPIITAADAPREGRSTRSREVFLASELPPGYISGAKKLHQWAAADHAAEIARKFRDLCRLTWPEAQVVLLSVLEGRLLPLVSRYGADEVWAALEAWIWDHAGHEVTSPGGLWVSTRSDFTDQYLAGSIAASGPAPIPACDAIEEFLDAFYTRAEPWCEPEEDILLLGLWGLLRHYSAEESVAVLGSLAAALPVLGARAEHLHLEHDLSTVGVERLLLDHLREVLTCDPEDGTESWISILRCGCPAEPHPAPPPGDREARFEELRRAFAADDLEAVT